MVMSVKEDRFEVEVGIAFMLCSIVLLKTTELSPSTV
jgi:hypothetical protein